MKQYDTALIIGRFQPFHNGHLYLLRETVLVAKHIIIGIGSTKTPDEDNPFSFPERKAMLDVVIEHEKLPTSLVRIIELPDFPRDGDWLKEVKRKVGSFSVIVGNNEWTNGIFASDGFPIMRVPFWKRYLLEGQRIRGLMRKKQVWEDRVPDYLVPQIRKLIDKSVYFSK